MTDLDFSYTISAPNLSSDTQTSLWSFNSVKLLPFDANTTALHNTRTNQGLLVQAEVAHALSLCKAFQSLDVHLENIMAAMPPLREKPEDARNILNYVKNEGFLESNSSAWQRLTNEVAHHHNSPSRLFILTCDRTEALARILENMVHLDLDSSIESIWVIDDSRKQASLDQNAGIISSLSDKFSVSVHHVEKLLQRELVDHLIETLPKHAPSISFLIDSNEWISAATYGRARNLALLLSVGFRAVILDDDIILQAIAPPSAGRQLKLGSPSDREAQFYKDHDHLMQHALNMGGDPVTLMLRNVGQTLGGLAKSRLSSPADLRGWDGDALSRHDSRSPILLNQCGTWGDPGTDDGNWIFFLPDSSITNLMEAGHGIKDLLAANSCWFGYRGETLSKYGVMSQITGLDHRNLLPPYFPAGRGEDLLFGIMLQRIHRDSLVLSEGWSVRHKPIESRPDRTGLTPLAALPGLHTLIDWLGREPEDQWGLSPQRRMQSLADDVHSLCEMDTEDLERLAGAQLASKRLNLLAKCSNHMAQLHTKDETSNTQIWTEFLSETQKSLVDALQSSEAHPITAALENRASADWSSLRGMGGKFASSLEAWPQICSAAKNFIPKSHR